MARASEIFAERWTPIIVRNLLMGSETFSDILRGAPGISKTLLTQRLRQLERVGVVRRVANRDGRGIRYAPTDAGRELWEVCLTLGMWGARWLEVAPHHLDPGLALWSMCKSLRPDRIPKDPLVVRFEFTDRPRRQRFIWLLIQRGEGEVCVKHPGFDEDVWVETDSETLVLWSLVGSPGGMRYASIRSRRTVSPASRGRCRPGWTRAPSPTLSPPSSTLPRGSRSRAHCHACWAVCME